MLNNTLSNYSDDEIQTIAKNLVRSGDFEEYYNHNPMENFNADVRYYFNRFYEDKSVLKCVKFNTYGNDFGGFEIVVLENIGGNDYVKHDLVFTVESRGNSIYPVVEYYSRCNCDEYGVAKQQNEENYSIDVSELPEIMQEFVASMISAVDEAEWMVGHAFNPRNIDEVIEFMYDVDEKYDVNWDKYL